MKKTFKYYIIVWAALLAVYNVIVFAVQPVMGFTKNYDTRFWLSWGFTILAFAGQLLCAATAFKSENKEKLFLNIPLITESYTALIVMTIAGSILMLIPDCPAWVAAIVCVAIAGFSAASVLSAKAAAELVSGVDEKIKVQTSFIRGLTVDAETLMTKAQTPEINAEIKKVYEAVRYSDPMSSDALSELETEISLKFSALSQAVATGNADAVKAAADDVVMMVSERNKKCKLVK